MPLDTGVTREGDKGEAMARSIRTEIRIQAPTSAVWATLLDFPRYREWNPFIPAIEGQAKHGEKLTAHFKGGMTFKPRVTEFREGAVLEWLGKLGLGGLFDGRHRFELRTDGNATVLVQSEQFSGLLIPFLGKLLKQTEKNFESMNQALKKRVESQGV